MKSVERRGAEGCGMVMLGMQQFLGEHAWGGGGGGGGQQFAGACNEDTLTRKRQSQVTVATLLGLSYDKGDVRRV